MSTGTTAATKQKQFRQLGVLIGLNFVDMMGFAMVFPLLPFYALKLNATPEMVGVLMSSYSIAQLVAAPVWGRVSDRYGRRPAMLIGLMASALAFLVFGLATSLWVLFLSRVVQGAGGGTTGVAQAYVSDTVAKEDRARALGWLSAATNAGISIGPAIGSLAAHFGRAAPGYFAAGLCFMNVIAAWRWLPETRTAEQRAASPPQRKPLWHDASEVVAHPFGARERLIWIYGIGMFAFSLLTGVLALWLGARFAIDEKSIGWYFVYYGLLSFVVRLIFLGPVVDKLGEVGTMRLGTLLLAAGMLMYPLATSIWMMVIIIPFVPIGTALLFPATTSLLSHSTDPGALGTTMGVAQSFAGVARIAAPILGGMAFQRIGISAPFIIGGLIVLMVAWVAFRHIRPVVSAEHAVT